MITHWFPPDTHDGNKNNVDCLCVGTGRFLRSVLVPAMVAAGFHPALIQTRGRSFLEYMVIRDKAVVSSSYEVDTVLASGETQTDLIPCYGAFSLGRPEDKQAVYDKLLPGMGGISMLGVGVTEAGLASAQTQAMHDLYQLICKFQELVESGQCKVTTPNQRICVINTDNVPNNGSVMQQHMETLAAESEFMQVFLKERMDRITSQREGSNGMVPRAEPVPAKALVLLDEQNDLPEAFTKCEDLGVVVRETASQLQADIALKLRVANGTHTAAAHVMALLKLTMTDALSADNDTAKLLMLYLDTLV
jgi:mannitol-1-phosphate/altronate dehydrogenase